ncbi:unnamed protein product [Boreogadus saida]
MSAVAALESEVGNPNAAVFGCMIEFRSGPQGRLILQQSTSAQRPSLVLQLFKLAVDGGPSFHVAQK